jgi:hypothetical protein
LSSFSLLLQVDSLNSQHSYIEKQLGSLEAASKPQENELDRLKELKKIISAEEREINRLTDGSKKLKEKVGFKLPNVCNFKFLCKFGVA